MNGESRGTAIYQQFVLNPEYLMEEGKQVDAQGNALSPRLRWKKVREAVDVYGLGLMCCPPFVSGVPFLVLIGIPVDCAKYLPLQRWFPALAAEYDLPFIAGDSYLSEFSANTSASVFSDKNYRAYLECRINEQWFKEHYGKWVAFVDCKLVATAEDEELILSRLEAEYSGRGAFYHHVLTKEEESKRAINFP